MKAIIIRKKSVMTSKYPPKPEVTLSFLAMIPSMMSVKIAQINHMNVNIIKSEKYA